MLVCCPKCDSKIRLNDRLYGRKVKCKCGAVIRMPQAPENAQSTSSNRSPATASMVEFQCPRCASQYRASAAQAGKINQCKCGAKVRIPSQTPVAPATQPIPLAGFDDLPELEPFENDPLFGHDPLAAPSAAPFATPAGNPYAKPAYLQTGGGKNTKPKVRKVKPKRESAGFTVNSQIVGGLLAMLGATVWFVGGLAMNIIFFYPPVLFVIGLVGVINGLVNPD